MRYIMEKESIKRFIKEYAMIAISRPTKFMKDMDIVVFSNNGNKKTLISMDNYQQRILGDNLHIIGIPDNVYNKYFNRIHTTTELALNAENCRKYMFTGIRAYRVHRNEDTIIPLNCMRVYSIQNDIDVNCVAPITTLLVEEELQ